MKRSGQNFETFLRFMFEVKNGKKAIIHGLDYIVMSRNLYEEITKSKPSQIFIDEEIPLPPEVGE